MLTKIKSYLGVSDKSAFDGLIPNITLFFMIVVCPFLFTTKTSWSPFENIKTYYSLFFISTVLIVQMLFSFRKNIQFEMSGWIYALIGFMLSMLASSVFSVDPLFSFIGSDQLPTGSFLSYFIVFVFVFYFYQNRDVIKRQTIITFFSIAGFLMSFYGVIQHFKLDPYDWFGYEEFHLRVFATIGNPIQYGMYVGAISFLLLSQYFKETRKSKTAVYLLMWVTSILATLYSGSRAPVLLQLGLLLIVLFYVSLFLKSDKTVKIKALVAVILFTCAHYFYYVENRNNAVAERLAPKAFNTGLKIRTTVWETGLKAGLEHPILGIGPELFFISYYKNKPASHNMYQTWSETMNKAHNELIQIWVTQGVIGLLALSAIFFLFFRQSIKETWGRTFSIEKISEFLIMSAVSFLILTNIFVFNLFPTLFLMVMLMTLVFWNQKSKKIQNKNLNLSKLARMTFVIFWIGLIYNIIPFWRANDLYCRAVFLKKTPQLYEALSAIKQAIEINPTRTYYNCNYAELLIQSYLLRKDKIKIDHDGFMKEIRSITDLCLNSQPYNFFTWHQVAYNYLKLAQEDKSLLDYTIATFNQALKLHPNTPLLFVELAYAYELKEDYNNAFRYFDLTLQQKNDFVEGYFRKLLPLYKLKKSDEISKTIDDLSKVDWENSTYKPTKMFLEGMILLASENNDHDSEMKLRLLKMKLTQLNIIN